MHSLGMREREEPSGLRGAAGWESQRHFRANSDSLERKRGKESSPGNGRQQGPARRAPEGLTPAGSATATSPCLSFPRASVSPPSKPAPRASSVQRAGAGCPLTGTTLLAAQRVRGQHRDLQVRGFLTREGSAPHRSSPGFPTPQLPWLPLPQPKSALPGFVRLLMAMGTALGLDQAPGWVPGGCEGRGARGRGSSIRNGASSLPGQPYGEPCSNLPLRWHGCPRGDRCRLRLRPVARRCLGLRRGQAICCFPSRQHGAAPAPSPSGAGAGRGRRGAVGALRSLA